MARQLPHVWRRFWSLPLGTDFFLGDRLYFKWDCWRASAAEFIKPQFTFVLPWRKVRTTQLLRDAPSGGLLPPGPSDAQLQEKVNLILHGTTHPQWSLPCDGSFNGEPRRANTSRRIEFILSGEKPFADDGRTGPSA